MRLKQIKIINFGQLSNVTFDLANDNLNLFFGANEAGKSTTVAFIKQIMFGFYLRSNSSPFFEDYKPLAHVSPMGGSLFFEDESGSTYELERLWAKGDKTKKGILTVKKDDQVIPEEVFFEQIQNIDGSFYADSFIFNQEMLGQVTSLSQADLLERIYYLGAADSSKLLQLRDGFDKEAGRLFKKTGKKPEVNRLLKELNDNRENLSETEEQFHTYGVVNRDLQSKLADLQKEQDQLKNLQKQAHELSDLKQKLTTYQELQDLQKKVRLIKFNSENYQKAQSIVAQLKNLQTSIAALEERLNELSVPQDFDYQQIRKLVQKRSELLQWQSEYKACLQKAAQIEAEKKQILAVDPDLKKYLQLSDDEVISLKKDYENLLAQNTATSEESQPYNSKLWFGVGAVIAIIGLILSFTNGIVGVVSLVLGILLLGYGFIQQRTADEVNKKQAHQRQMQEKLKHEFLHKYNLDPQQLDLKVLANEKGQYLLKASAEKANNDQLTALKKQTAQLAKRLENVLNKPINSDFNNLLEIIDKLDEQLDQEKTLRDRKNNLESTLKEDQQHQHELKLKLQTVLAVDNVEKVSDYNERYQEFLRQEKLATQIKALKDNLGSQVEKLQTLNEKNDAFADQENKLKNDIFSQEEKVNDLQSDVAEIKVKLANFADSTTVFEAKQKLANTETSFSKASQEYLANLLAARWIDRALDVASNERFPKMLKSACEYFKLLTGGRYVDLELAKKITVVRFDGKKREVKYLSRGTAEQLYFALKLAFIEQIKDQINLPILIDDSFVNFDDQRIEYIEELLRKISENNQVLIFTAQKSLVDKLNIKALTFEKGTAYA